MGRLVTFLVVIVLLGAAVWYFMSSGGLEQLTGDGQTTGDLRVEEKYGVTTETAGP